MIHFCTFGNIPQYSRSINELVTEAKASNYFNTVKEYNQNNLSGIENHHEFIKSNIKGYGYWIWKSILLIDMFSKTNEGDIIIYADAGCGISIRENAKKKFKQWIDTVTNNAPYRISFQMTHLEKVWTKNDLFDIMDCNDDKYKNTGQNVANIQIYKNNKDNLDFIKEYYKFCCLNNYHYVTDEPSYSLNDPMFKEHRHDQSILSLLFKKYGASVFPDHWNDYEYPIIAIRRKY